MRASSVVMVFAVVAGYLSAAVHGQTVQGTTTDEQAIRDLVALHASASQQDDLEGLVVGLDSVSVAGQGPRTPFFLVFTKVQGKWGVAVERSGVPLK